MLMSFVELVWSAPHHFLMADEQGVVFGRFAEAMGKGGRACSSLVKILSLPISGKSTVGSYNIKNLLMQLGKG
jgi:hypothetical protein